MVFYLELSELMFNELNHLLPPFEVDDKEPFEITIVYFLPPNMHDVIIHIAFPDSVTIRSVEIKDSTFMMAISVQ